jgi:hypothetical protein
MNCNLFQKMEVTENKVNIIIYRISTLKLKEMIMPYVKNMGKIWKNATDQNIKYFISMHPLYTNYQIKLGGCFFDKYYLDTTIDARVTSTRSLYEHFHIIGLIDECVLYVTSDQFNMCRRIHKDNPIKSKSTHTLLEKDDQCVICFEPTERKQLCAPCGHTQYCDHCIGSIHECAICRTQIDKIIKIY